MCVERWSADPVPVPRVHDLRAEELPALRRHLRRRLELRASHGPSARHTGTQP